MTTPRQRRGRSRQIYVTPPELMRAIERDFSVREWAIDLAATRENSKSARAYFGPGSPWGKDALAINWADLEGDAWLNPPFANLQPWATKCQDTRAKKITRSTSGRIFLLTPASTGSEWYADHVDGVAHVVSLRPRVTFVGEKEPYPKDLILSVFGPIRGGFSTWQWK